MLIKSYTEFNFKFLCLEKDTDGAAETINTALKNIDLEDQSVICLDSDNFYKFNIVEKWNETEFCIYIYRRKY